jgi:hypothetical protein
VYSHLREFIIFYKIGAPPHFLNQSAHVGIRHHHGNGITPPQDLQHDFASRWVSCGPHGPVNRDSAEKMSACYGQSGRHRMKPYIVIISHLPARPRTSSSATLWRTHAIPTKENDELQLEALKIGKGFDSWHLPRNTKTDRQ